MIRIPPQNMEIEQIYSRVMGEKNRAVAIISPNHGEGVTSIALALAQRNLLAGHTTLLVDLNLYKPSLEKLLPLDIPRLKDDSLDTPQLITVQQQPIALVGITAPSRRDMVIKLRKPGVLEQFIVEWQKIFETIIFDTSPLNRINANNIPAERVAAACDGCLMVVLAGNTAEAMVSAAVEKLAQANATLLGCIFNDRDNPTLKNELLREILRLEPRFRGLSTQISDWIRNSHLLSTQI